MRVLVTGCCGFIGYHVCKTLLGSDKGYEVLGVDCLTGLDYQRTQGYSPPTEQTLRRDRLGLLKSAVGGFIYLDLDLTRRYSTNYDVFRDWRPEGVIHLAAVSSPRGSPPEVYLTNNVLAHLNILKGAAAYDSTRQIPIVYASSCAVYGSNVYASLDDDRYPLSAYGVSKVENEYFARVCALTMGMRVLGLRLFNVYGPWDRSTSALSLFARALLAGERITLYSPGVSPCTTGPPFGKESPEGFLRDYVFVDDVVSAFISGLEHPPSPYRHIIRNAGTGIKTKVRVLPWMLAAALGISHRDVRVEEVPGPPGEPAWAVACPDSCSWKEQMRDTPRWSPQVKLEDGILRFAEWFKSYYGKVVEP